MRDNYTLKTDSKTFLYPEEYLKIEKLANPKQLFTMKVLVNTGMRINEARYVVRKDIDDERQTVIIKHTKVRAKLKEKRSNPREIPLSTQFYNYYRLNINKYKILSTNQTGVVLKKLAKEVGTKYSYKDFSAHNLRKTFGTWMLALNVDGFKLAQYLGHSPEMLRTKYASPDIFNYKDKDMIRDILGNLPNRLRGE